MSCGAGPEDERMIRESGGQVLFAATTTATVRFWMVAVFYYILGNYRLWRCDVLICDSWIDPRSAYTL